MVLAVIAFAFVAVAAAMTFAASRVIRRERLRSSARVAALAAAIHDTPDFSPDERIEAPTLGGAALVVGVAVAVVVFACVDVFRTAITSSPAEVPTKPAGARREAPAPASTTLELLALNAERGDKSLTVRGLARNPGDSAEVRHLAAVVLLFNEQGTFLTSGRGQVDAPALEPGTEAPFSVTIPVAADIGRYRVSFRTDDRVVPHVDRRARES